MCKQMLMLILCCGWCVAAVAQSPEEKIFMGKDAELQKRISDVMAVETARASTGLCEKTAGGNPGYANCLSVEFKKTDHNYTELVLALGAYLRLQEPGRLPLPTEPGGRISFDDGETGWQTYRAKLCDAVSETYRGGTLEGAAFVRCEVVVTRSHMKELTTQLHEN